MNQNADGRDDFSPELSVRALLTVEAALARAQARIGIIPGSAATDITAAAANPSEFDVAALIRDAQAAGNLVIPLVQALTDVVAARNASSAGFVHWGATSQDILDTALALQMREAFRRICAHLDAVRAELRALVGRHRNTLMVARTLMQQALPSTFGLKAAYWLAPVSSARRRIQCLADDLPVQLGGAAGTLAALGQDGTAVADALAAELGLRSAPPWHTDRSVIAESAAVLGMLGGSLAKIAGDILLMAQTEVGELAEKSSGGGSSTLPHKQNAVALVEVVAATRRLPGLVATVLACLPHEHERAAGNWHAERAALPELFAISQAACAHLQTALSRLHPDVLRMRRNLDLTGGLVMTESVAMGLAPRIGRHAAQALAKRVAAAAVAEGIHLREALADDPQASALLSPDLIETLLDPQHYLGDAERIIERILEADDRCEMA